MHKQIIGYHIVMCSYGFWLPNDYRGSGSDEIRAKHLRPFGPATKTNSAQSVAHRTLTPQQRKIMRQAKEALKYPVVILDGQQALSVARGFERVVLQNNIDVYACSIMPEHIHLVTGMLQDPDTVVEQLKQSADDTLRAENRFPESISLADEKPRTTIWAEKYWKRFLYYTEDLLGTIFYAEQNPLRAGLKTQVGKWRFVRTFP